MVEYISMFFVLSGFICALLIKFDINLYYPQKMKIMGPVWILTGLWANLIGTFTYFKIGRNKNNANMPNIPMPKNMANMSMDMPMDMGMHDSKPLWQKVIVSTLHCGAGCTLADIIGEWATIFFPVVIANSSILGQWTLDYFLALFIGVGFQYAAIKPMENLPVGKTIMKAFKIDFFSLTSWQVGMYGWMAIAIFYFNNGNMLDKTSWYFWFMMQIAMFCGFLTAYPTNWLLIKLGIKKVM